ncbi:multiprotein-bridging factor 1 family protein [Streptacidiphilus sp. MAP12-16]|uniref:helix-turn-helix domain-containing protein n=1 Tax=Streptacidiphilus sp. MAP12-16 TaxID=3156300 RepID=UPI003519C07F
MIRERRQGLGWSQAQLARAAGTGQAVVSRIEAGHLNPTVDMLGRLADAMDADLGLMLLPRATARRSSSDLVHPGRSTVMEVWIAGRIDQVSAWTRQRDIVLIVHESRIAGLRG